jgi:HNH endonuclease
LGVGRKIPAHIRREVRKACGFGCVICGKIATDYEHIVPFSESQTHSVDNIVLLCLEHHGEVTRGRLSKQFVVEAQKNPAAYAQSVSAQYQLMLGSHTKIQVGNLFVDFSDTKKWDIISVCDKTLLTLEIIEGKLVASATFNDFNGNESLIIEQNVVELRTKRLWDVRLSGTSLIVEFGKGHKVLELQISGSILHIRKMAFHSSKVPVLVNENGFHFGWTPSLRLKSEGSWVNSVSGGMFSSNSFYTRLFDIDILSRLKWPIPPVMIRLPFHPAPSHSEAYRFLFDKKSISQRPDLSLYIEGGLK